MREAALTLSDEDKSRTTLLIDGLHKLRWESPAPPWREIPIVRGDVKSVLIELAAIIVNEHQDAHMRRMHHLYPQYGFGTNMGHLTPEHRRAIALLGPCPHPP